MGTKHTDGYILRNEWAKNLGGCVGIRFPQHHLQSSEGKEAACVECTGDPLWVSGDPDGLVECVT